MTKSDIAASFKELQGYICRRLNEVDKSAEFLSDDWKRNQGGGGITRAVSGGEFIEKGGVAFSEVFGPVTESMAKQLKLDGVEFFATGVSIVLHSKSPLHPIIHMNVRYFEMDNGTYWFGGGIDLTPIYIDKLKAKKFHLGLKNLCDGYDLDMYLKYKKWADDYFYLPHRNETRGVGGIFFDHLSKSEKMTKNQVFEFCIALGKLFPELYAAQLSTNNNDKVNEATLQWQMLRRSRYVEFNLLHDRGTKFGIYSGGRTESILMSMPPVAQWSYNFKPEETSNEANTLALLKKDIDWLK